MKNYLLPQEKRVREEHRSRRKRQRIVAGLAAAAIFGTVSALTFPAITMEDNVICNLEEHSHEASCYQTVTVPAMEKLICPMIPHEHTESCVELGEDGEQSCAEEIHCHNEDCYQQVEEQTEEILTCTVPVHIHTDECFTTDGILPEESEEEVIEETPDEGLYVMNLAEFASEVDGLRAGELERNLSFTKSAKSTGVENLFDIQLDIKLPNEKAPAIVLAIDISSSMKNQCAVCGVPDGLHQTPYITNGYYGEQVTNVPCSAFTERFGIAEAAAVNFLNMLGNTAENGFRECYVSVVAFDRDARVFSDWYDVAQPGGLSAAISQVNGLRAIEAHGTGLSFGMKAAYDKMTDLPSGVTPEGSFLVLLSDGATYDPTTALDPAATSPAMVESWLQRWRNYDHFDYLPDMDPSKYMGAPYYAQRLKESGAHVYSVALGVSVDNGVRGNLSNWKYIMGIGIDNDDYIESFSDYTYKATSQTSLDLFYTNVYNSVSCVVSDLVITDPMSENVDFLSFLDENGNPIDPPAGAAYDAAARTITWRPMGDSKQHDLYYRVHLKNEKSGFVQGAQYPTNGRTTAEYNMTMGGTTGYGSMEAQVPKVSGYLGARSLTKVDEQGNGLSGAVFSLTHDVGHCLCDTYGSVAIGTYTAISGQNGAVNFSNIPSGHNYVLREIEPPTGYRLSDETHVVSISYGKVTVDGSENWSGLIVNEQGAVTLTVNKTVNAPNTAGVFHFTAQMDGGKLPAPTENQNSYTVDEAGIAHFDLEHGQSVTLEGIPSGAIVTVTETNPEGYFVLMKIGDVTLCTDHECRLTVDDSRTLTVVNTSGYELPATGGVGTTFLYAFGALVTACALMYGYALRRKQERRAE